MQLISSSLTKLEQEIRTSEELRLKVEEEKAKIVKERNEAQTMVKIVEANLKLKSFVIETLRQKLGQVLLELGNKSKKLKTEKVKNDVSGEIVLHKCTDLKVDCE